MKGYFATGDHIEKIETFDKFLMPKAHEEAINEVGDVPKEIRKMLTYEFERQYPNTKEYRDEKVLELSNSALGTESIKGKIANYTLKIRKGRKLLREQPNQVGVKIMTNYWRNKRMRYLCLLSKFDMDGYKQLCKDLQIDELELTVGEQLQFRIERKRELRRLTKEYCDEIIKTRLNKYHEKLKEQQESFEKEKTDFEKWMHKTMDDLKIDEKSVQIDTNK